MLTEEKKQNNSNVNFLSKEDKNTPIGIFDSGVGGLSIFSKIKKLLPKENLVYYADTLYAPYGAKTNDFIENRSMLIAEWLIKKKSCKAIVIACNTASAYIAEKLRTFLSIPIIAIEPGIKPAALVSKKKKIGILATAATLRSPKYLSLHNHYAKNYQLITVEANDLVVLVENGDVDSSFSSTSIQQHCKHFIDLGVDSLVLGCTHYTFLKKSFIKLSNNTLTIIETSEAVVKYLKQQLKEHHLERCNMKQSEQKIISHSIFTSGNAEQFSIIASKLLHEPCIATNLIIK